MALKGSRPVSRVLSWTAIHLGCTSPYTSSDLPGNSAGNANAPLFGLAPGGVYPATAVTSRAVRSYRTISPLPAPKRWRYIFCGTFRRLAPPRRYLAPCPVEPGLSSMTEVTAAVRPASDTIVVQIRCRCNRTSVGFLTQDGMNPELYNILFYLYFPV